MTKDDSKPGKKASKRKRQKRIDSSTKDEELVGLVLSTTSNYTDEFKESKKESLPIIEVVETKMSKDADPVSRKTKSSRKTRLNYDASPPSPTTQELVGLDLLPPSDDDHKDSPMEPSEGIKVVGTDQTKDHIFHGETSTNETSRIKSQKRDASLIDQEVQEAEYMSQPDEDKEMFYMEQPSKEILSDLEGNDDEDHVQGQLKMLLRVLCSTHVTAVLAEEVVRKLVNILFCSKDEKRVEAIKYFLRYHGIPLIAMSLYRWGRKSKEFAFYAIKCLYTTIVLEGASAKMIVDIGGVHAILRVCQKYRKDEHVVVNAIRLLDVGNVTMGGTIGEGFTTKECVDFVFRTLKAFPNDEGVYFLASWYVQNILTRGEDESF